MENIIIYGGSFNPTHKAHKLIAKALEKNSDKLFIVPCGVWKESTKSIPTIHRINMINIAFKDVNAIIDFYDLNNEVYTPTYLLNEKYQNKFPKSKIWIAIGEDSIANGRNGKSEIHRIWDYGNDIWDNLNWIIISRQGYGAQPEDLPPKSIIIEVKDILGSGTLIRKLIKEGKPVSHFVEPEIEDYIKKYGLYQKE